MKIDIVEFGQPTIQCEYCLGEVWYEERSQKSKTFVNVDFSICCQKGKVQLPFLQEPHKLLLELSNGQDSRSEHYLQILEVIIVCFHLLQLEGMFNLR